MLRWASWLWGASWRPWTVRCLGLLCGLFTVVALGMVLLQATQLKAQAEKVRSVVVQNEVNARPPGAARLATASVVTPAQADAMNEVVDRLNLPWAHLLNDLETLTPSSIAVLQIEPLVAANALRWQVEAKSHQAVFAYLDKLGAASTLNQVRLVKFETNTQDPNRPIRFVLEAVLVPVRHDTKMASPLQSAVPMSPATRVSGKSP